MQLALVYFLLPFVPAAEVSDTTGDAIKS